VTLLPGAAYDPGAHWNGEAGWSSCLTLVWHYTVGTDSRALIRNQGLAAALVWDDVIWQFAPLEAVCFTECEWNRRSIGIECESLDGTLSPKQIANLGYITLFCLTTFGIPQQFYDGPRLPVGYDYRGVTNHRALQHVACDQHGDGFDTWVWDAITAPPSDERKKKTMASFLIVDQTGGPDTGKVFVVDADANTKCWIRSPQQLDAHQQVRNIIKFTGGWADADVHGTSEPDRPWAGMLASATDLTPKPLPPPAPGGGVSAAQVQAIVEADGELTRDEIAKPRQVTGTVVSSG